MVPVTRLLTMAMMGVICFALVFSLVSQRHNAVLAGIIVALFVAYLGVNAVLWRRFRPRA
ncbi:MAG: hypothetical protein JOY69_01155 [Candidatus Eremiobacteraeota bacterium]|nr:hypothetical protein [Candidatus Eremiobacteraeota bacterium]MBV8371842.1 hypothetical protein [Candidatus Eremiobacteraeota bacterium]